MLVYTSASPLSLVNSVSKTDKAYDTCVLSDVRLFATPRIAACQAPLSVGFPRQEYWSGFPFPPPGDLPNPGIEPGSTVLEADSSPTEPAGKPKRSQAGVKRATALSVFRSP